MNKPQGLDKLAELVSSPDKPILLRGEIWVASKVLEAAGLSQDPKGILELASMMEADISFFPWSKPLMPFDLKEMVDLSHSAGMGCGVTIDGPFQRLVQERGLLSVLGELGKWPLNFKSLLAEESEKIVKTLELVENSGIDLILICDDLAYSSGLYFSPAIFRESLLPLYRIFFSQISKKTLPLGWHSDGNVSTILPDIVDCGFRFFSLESECINLLDLKRTYRNRMTLIGGIRTAWLAQGVSDPAKQKEFLEETKALAREGGLILSSSCGLYNPKFLSILKEIYRLAEGIEESIGGNLLHFT